MPTTPNYNLPYPALADPADVPTDMSELALAIDALPGLTPGPTTTYGTTPPATPAEGDEWTYPVGNGVLWRFRYNAGSASAYKWELVGGAAATAQVLTAEASATIGAWIDLATIGPRITVARAGEYACNVNFRAGLGAGTAYAGAAIGAGTPPGPYPSLYVPASQIVSAAGLDCILTLAAGQEIRLRYHQTAAFTPGFDQRLLSVRPVRVS